MSTVGAGKYLDLVKQAMDGKLKLPAFQREWKWKRKQVVELFDSLRNQYPIGSFLLAKVGGELDLSPRSFAFTSGGSEGEDHHTFPTRYVPGLKGWDEKTMTANVVLNIMRVAKKTNAEYLNSDPRDQMLKAQGANPTKLADDLRDQAITQKCLELLLKAEKSADDFSEFVRLREIEVQKLINEEFQFQITAKEPDEVDV